MSILKKLSYLVIAGLFLGTSAATVAAEQGNGSGEIVISDTMHASATVVKVNKKTREITLKNAEGEETTFVAGKQVRNFNQIKKGDVVEVEYHVSAASELKKASDADMAGSAEGIARAPAGQKPGVAVMRTSTIVASVVQIDKAKRLVAVKGPKGNIVVIKVPAKMKAFDELKVGDNIVAQLTEALAISVKTPAKKK